MNQRKNIYYIFAKISKCLSQLCVFHKNENNYNISENLLKKNNYAFKPIWTNLPRINERIKDLSIIIPIYNSESFLSYCLDSILIQNTKYDYEVICINDGSKDHSGEILKQYQVKYPHRLIVFEQENQGISAARNKGIELSKGRYIGFIDNDDTVSPYYVETLMDSVIDTSCDIVQCGYAYKNTKGDIISTEIKEQQLIDSTEKEKLFYNVQGYIWGGCFNSALFSKVRFPIGFWYEDMITRMLLMRQAKKIAIIGKALYNKTIHETNASKVIWKNQNIKAVDQYYLAKQLSDYSINYLSQPIDDLLYNVLLTEWSHYLWVRTRGLNESIRKSVFILASDYIKFLHSQAIIKTYNKKLQIVAKAFLNNNYIQWKLISLALLFEAKAKEQ